MRTLIFLLASILLLSPITADAQDSRAALEAVAKALGATGLKSIEIQGGGTFFWVGQSYTAGTAWPQFNVRSLTRVVNYDTASFREEMVRTRALEPPKGGGPYVRGEHKAVAFLSGDHAWNVTGDAATPAPITLADRQFQLWATPHGVIKAAMAGRGTIQGRTIAFGVPGSFKATATLDAANLVERVDATMTNPVLGDMAVTVSYADFDHSGGVRAFAGEGATLITHDASRQYFERIVAAPATVSPDHLAKSGRKAAVEGVRDRRVLTDGTRTVEIREIAGILHADDMLMVYLPKEKFLIEADAYTPPAPNTAPMSPPSPFNVSLAENITKQGLAVDQILPLHGRMVPLAELHKAAGVTP